MVNLDKEKREEIKKILDMMEKTKITHRDLGMSELKGSKSSVISDAINLFKQQNLKDSLKSGNDY